MVLMPLREAVEAGDLGKVRELLDAGASQDDATDNAGRTPLFVACKHGHKGVAELLLVGRCKLDPSLKAPGFKSST